MAYVTERERLHLGVEHLSFRKEKFLGAVLDESVCDGAKSGGQGSESEVWLLIPKTERKAEMAALRNTHVCLNLLCRLSSHRWVLRHPAHTVCSHNVCTLHSRSSLRSHGILTRGPVVPILQMRKLRLC